MANPSGPSRIIDRRSEIFLALRTLERLLEKAERDLEEVAERTPVHISAWSYALRARDQVRSSRKLLEDYLSKWILEILDSIPPEDAEETEEANLDK